jgi:hypothetical protein
MKTFHIANIMELMQKARRNMVAGRSELRWEAITSRVSITVEGINRRRLSLADAILRNFEYL